MPDYARGLKPRALARGAVSFCKHHYYFGTANAIGIQKDSGLRRELSRTTSPNDRKRNIIYYVKSTTIQR
jgi:hypothetical protein